MVEVSRDGQRAYFINSLYGAWDDQFNPDGVGAWMAKLDAPAPTGAEDRRELLPTGGVVPWTARAPDPQQGGDAPRVLDCHR